VRDFCFQTEQSSLE